MSAAIKVLLIVSQLSPEAAWDVLRYAVLWLVRHKLAGFSDLYAIQALHPARVIEEAA
jgi:hypothetical protein